MKSIKWSLSSHHRCWLWKKRFNINWVLSSKFICLIWWFFLPDTTNSDRVFMLCRTFITYHSFLFPFWLSLIKCESLFKLLQRPDHSNGPHDLSYEHTERQRQRQWQRQWQRQRQGPLDCIVMLENGEGGDLFSSVKVSGNLYTMDPMGSNLTLDAWRCRWRSVCSCP